MPLPSNPSNNQTAVVNGILYTYNSTKGAWSVTTNSEASYNMSAITASGLVTAANIKTTAGVFWANGAPYGGSAGGSTNSIQYNSSNTFAGATNFTYTAQTGNVVIGATTATSSTTTGALVVGGGAGIAGNVTVGDAINFTGAAPEIVFTAANPWINATSYIHFPGGAYFNSGTVYTEAALRARGGIINDTGTKILTIGSASQLSVANTMTSTSSSTGALIVAGGVGIAGNLNTGSTSINGSLVGSTTSPLQITGDVTLSGANRSVLGNMYYQGGWKYAANGAAWGFRENNAGKLQFLAAPVNSSGALAAASPTYPITLDLTSGNVAIGFDSPTALFHVKDGTNATYVEPTGNWAGKIFNATDAANEHGLVVGQRWAAAASTAFEVGSTYGGGTGSWRSYFKIDGLGGMTMSSGGSDRILMDSTTGNLIINATTVSTSTTTGALVVKGGAGIAGQVTAGNVMTTSGVFWANGAAYSSGSGGGAIATTGIFLNSNVITANATISSGQNGFSVGPMTQSNGVVVTIAPGQRWVIV